MWGSAGGALSREESLDSGSEAGCGCGSYPLGPQEVDRIIIQMMRMAEYLDWDVSELRPVRQFFLHVPSYTASLVSP